MSAPFASRFVLAVLVAVLSSDVSAQQSDPLPSWSERTRQPIVHFVARATTQGSPDFVQVDQRIATFDNDGTLWAEQPMYFQVQFAIDRIKAMAPQHPEWKIREPFKSVLAGDRAALARLGEKGLLQSFGVARLEDSNLARKSE